MNVRASFEQVKFNSAKLKAIKGVGTPLIVLAALAMIVLPMAPFLLDMLFSFNIALALVVLLAAIYTSRPLDFAAFPTVLLVATLLRLALNVASTRVVLLDGHNGGDAAGKVIESFGSVVIGGNYAVGLVVFIILIIINFVVITKGAGRISEVSARFILDAMPGKQMAIDADLNAGILNQEQAKLRREEVTQEADFYGAMDGASKFVKGDAIAGILILVVNMLGGFSIGMLQHDLDFSSAAEIYTLLTIGDGLVAQIPGLLLSIAAALMVTRQNKTGDMGHMMLSQMFESPKALAIASVVLLIMGIVPGMPHFAFLFFTLISGSGAYYIYRRNNKNQLKKVNAIEAKQSNDGVSLKELTWDDLHHVDTIGLEVGYRLIPLVDKGQGGELLGRIKGVRKKLSQDLGFLVPSVHIRDNLDLAPNVYRISLMGVVLADAIIRPECELAINPGQVFGSLDGEETKDPAFGLDAVWINPEQREQAHTLGYTVVDAPTVVATHISQLLTNNASKLMGYEEVQQLLDMLSKECPKLVDGFIPDVMPLGTVVKVMQNLLNEGVSVRDVKTIIQTLLEYGPQSSDTEVLTAACRIALKRMIVQEIAGPEVEIPVITLAPELEQMLHQSIQASGGDGPNIEPGLAERMQQSLVEATQNQEIIGQPAILLTSGMLRSTLSRFVKYTIPNLRVISYQEVPDEKQIRIVSTVGK